MFGMLSSLTKAVVGVVVETPLSVAADVITMGGVLTDKEEPYTSSSIKGIMENIKKSTNPD